MSHRLLPYLIAAAALLVALVPARPAHAQFGDGLSIYGFFQTQGLYTQDTFTSETPAGPISTESDGLSFSVQQLNVFLANQFSPSFSAFVNAEIRNTLSTADGFGELRLEEAWLRYNHSGAFNLKAGRLVPQYNNLNEVKNRTPLLPYVYRPLVYESSLHRTIPMEQFVPDHAYVQAYGTVPAGEIRVDYAAYIGNSESSYLAPAGDFAIAGTDTTLSKLVGGRLGARWQGVKVGISGTYDKRWYGDVAGFDPITFMPTDPIPGTGLGDLKRSRLGLDLSFSAGRFFGEAEAIQVRYHFSDAQEARIAENMANFLMFSESMDAQFYYGLLGANITDQWFAYGRYDFYSDDSMDFGIDTYSVGGGFRPIDQVALKVQYVTLSTRENDFFGVDHTGLYAAVSVSF